MKFKCKTCGKLETQSANSNKKYCRKCAHNRHVEHVKNSNKRRVPSTNPVGRPVMIIEVEEKNSDQKLGWDEGAQGHIL